MLNSPQRERLPSNIFAILIWSGDHQFLWEVLPVLIILGQEVVITRNLLLKYNRQCQEVQPNVSSVICYDANKFSVQCNKLWSGMFKLCKWMELESLHHSLHYMVWVSLKNNVTLKVFYLNFYEPISITNFCSKVFT